MKCFDFHKEQKIACQKKNCRYWMKHNGSMNCTLIAANKGSMTLQEIGDIFGVTRMRVCQLEKRIIKKIESYLDGIVDI